MIVSDGKILRNLQEQVEANKDSIQFILAEQGVLNQFGIKVIGEGKTIADLPDPATYGGDYGDAYAIGSYAPYNLYIYTREFTGTTGPHWFNIGKFPVQGPQGSTGPQGPQGLQGNAGIGWINKNPDTTLPFDVPVGTFAFEQTTGKVYYHNASDQWTSYTDLKGPQGVQGPQGIKGDTGEQGPQGPQGAAGTPGTSVPIKYIVATTGALPAPEIGASALVKTNSGYDLYICAENDNKVLIWQNLGAFMAGTAVTASGVVQQIFDADTKLDKVTSTSATRRAYVILGDGSQTTQNVTDYSAKGAIAYREFSTGNIYAETANADSQPKALTNVEYVKANFIPVPNDKVNFIVPSFQNGIQSYRGVSYGNTANNFVFTTNTGHINILEPTASNHPATKNYVDSKVAIQHQAKLYIAGNIPGWGNGFMLDVNSVAIPNTGIIDDNSDYVALFSYPSAYSGSDVTCVQLMVKIHYDNTTGDFSIKDITAISDYQDYYNTPIEYGRLTGGFTHYDSVEELQAARTEHSVIGESWFGWYIV